MAFVSATNNNTLMGNARRALSKKWGPAIAVFLVFIVFQILVESIPAVGWAIGLVINGPIAVGLSFYVLTLVRGKTPKFSQAFEGFNIFGLSVTASLLMVLFLFLWALIFIIPAIIGGFAIYSMLPESLMYKGCHHRSLPFESLPPEMHIKLFVSVALLIVAIIPLTIPTIMAGLSYSMTHLLIADKRATKPLQAIKMSRERMKGNKAKLFRLFWRFFGWLLLSIITLGVGFLWLFPYVAVTMAQFYTDLKEKK